MAIKETVFILCLVLLPLIMGAKQPKEPTKTKKSFVELFADPCADCICCKDGWVRHGRHCYFVEKELMSPSMQDARDRCKELGGNLPIIRSADQNRFIFDQIKDVEGISKWGVWIDAYRGADGKFAWGDGTPLEGNYNAWKIGEPNNLDDNEDCAHMYAKEDHLASFWNDIRCNLNMPNAAILCQKSL